MIRKHPNIPRIPPRSTFHEYSAISDTPNHSQTYRPILSGEKSVISDAGLTSNAKNTELKIETLENLIADKLKIINDIDSKLGRNMSSARNAASVKY